MPDREQLGFVTCPSGVLIVIDTGYLGIWSHDQPPMLRRRARDCGGHGSC
jgi:hypothetical protein